MTPEQSQTQSTIQTRSLENGWKSLLKRVLLDRNPDFSPQALLEFHNGKGVLQLEYHAEPNYLMLVVANENQQYVGFRLYFTDFLDEVLTAIYACQNELNLDSFPDYIGAIQLHCRSVFVKQQSKPPLRLSPEPGSLLALQKKLFPKEEITPFDGPKYSIFAEPARPELPDRVKPPPKTSKFVTEKPKGAVQPASSAEEQARVVARFARQHKKMADLIRIALDEASEANLSPEHPLMWKRNVAQWIESQQLELVLLMQTHDADSRNPDKGYAYFGAEIKYPGGEGRYPENPKEESETFVYAAEDPDGGWVEGTHRIELYNPEKKRDSWLWDFFRQAVSDHISYNWKLWFPPAPEVADFPFLKGWNDILSPRIFDLVQSICAHPKKKKPNGKDPLVAEAFSRLDSIDQEMFRDPEHTHLFWDGLKRRNPGGWAFLYNEFRI